MMTARLLVVCNEGRVGARHSGALAASCFRGNVITKDRVGPPKKRRSRMLEARAVSFQSVFGAHQAKLHS